MPRHSFVRRLVSLLLAVLVLTASVGLTVQRLTCRLSGRSQVAVALAQPHPAGCAANAAPVRPQATDTCCEVSIHQHKLSAPAHALGARVTVPGGLAAAIVPVLRSWVAAPQVVRAAVRARWFAADSPPPRPGGRGLLALVGALRV